jgi:hypothetical protein
VVDAGGVVELARRPRARADPSIVDAIEVLGRRVEREVRPAE